MARKIAGSIPLKDLAAKVGGAILGNGDIQITNLCSLEDPLPGGIAFMRSKSLKNIDELVARSPIAALLVGDDIEGLKTPDSIALVKVKDPYAALVSLLPLFYEMNFSRPGISKNADIHPSAKIGSNVSIGAFCAVGENVRIDDNVTLHPNVIVYPDVVIGAGSIIHSGAVIREGCELGKDTILQNGAIVGADGFGYVPDPVLGLKAVPQVGFAVLGDRVEIGANSCVDRATLGVTAIGKGTKIDNLAQVGHNCKVGANTIICGQVGLAGSSKIGSGVILGGQAGVADHATIGDGVKVGAKAGVTHNLYEKGEFLGYPAIERTTWARQIVALKRLTERTHESKNTDPEKKSASKKSK